MKKLKTFSVTLEPVGYFSSKLSSYTIFGAICWAVTFLYGEREISELINLVKTGGFFLSSSMPIVDGKHYVFKPILKPEHIEMEDVNFLISRGDNKDSEFRNLIKKFKKLPFVPSDILKKVAKGTIKSDKELILNLGKGIEETSPFVDLALPHAKLNRITNSTSEGGEFYFEESLFFKSKVYFLVAVEEDNILNDLIIPSLNLLQDWGIGGNRSVGFGNFSFKANREEKIDEFINGNSREFITLSPVVATDRIDYERSFYDIKTYKGTMESGYQDFLWKPKIFYLQAGSLIRLKENSKFAGALIKPFEGIELYHYGLEFPIYIKEIR